MKESESQSTSQEIQPLGSLVLPDQVLPPHLFILPTQSAVVFPTLMAPVLVQNPRFIATVEEVISKNRTIGLLMTKDDLEVTEKLKSTNLHQVGVVVKILKRIKMPDGSVNLLIHSVKRFKIKGFLSEDPHFVVDAEYLEDVTEKSTEMDAFSRAAISHVKKLSEVNPFFTEEMRLAMINAPGPGTVADLVAFALALPKNEAQEFLEIVNVKERFEKLLVHLRREQDVADLQKKISDEVNGKITKLQREFFLKEQLKSIKKELGVEVDGKEKNSQTFRERIENSKMPDDVRKTAFEELDKFETINENSPEHNILRNYLELLCALPWGIETADNLDLTHARQVLDDEHFGLEKVKERIIEFLAIRRLKKNPKGSIICLVGPPGVGKTSIGKSVAKSLARNFYRFSLGGMRDEAEIKGHRRTYVGALPGKLIQAIKRAGSSNAVLMLDEIDKLGQSFQGDPASALLEALDPEQNHAFLDHYLDVPFDLSKVLFIATANNLQSIPAPLLDRMEVIELPGYTLEEKEDIASRYLLPKILTETGLKPNFIRFEKAAWKSLMTDYSREPGLRTLQQLISKVARKAAAKVVIQKEDQAKMSARIVIKAEDLKSWLGPKRFYNETAERITAPGVVTGLAWTAMGGDILFIEAQDLPGSGQLKITGQLGEVMTESAAIAYSYVKKRAEQKYGIDPEFFKTRDIHIHVPSGAIPKDGPSAGVTIASALLSLLTGRVSRTKTAMTGELSLIGKVLPVGGIKEKILAAKRAGIQTVIIPWLNEKDLSEVPSSALEGMTIRLAKDVDQVFDWVLQPLQLNGTKKPSSLKKKKSKVIRTGQSVRKANRIQGRLV